MEQGGSKQGFDGAGARAGGRGESCGTPSRGLQEEDDRGGEKRLYVTIRSLNLSKPEEGWVERARMPRGCCSGVGVVVRNELLWRVLLWR